MATSDFYEDDENYSPVTLAKILESMSPQHGPLQNPAMEMTAEDMASNLGYVPDPTAVSDMLSPDLSSGNIAEMGKKQQLDFNASKRDNTNPPQNFTLDEINQLNDMATGRTGVPGTESFMHPGQRGSYRAESEITPEGIRATQAAGSLRSFNKNKFGGSGRYGGAGADVLNSAESTSELARKTYALGSAGRAREQAALSRLEQYIAQATGAGGRPDVIADMQGELGMRSKIANREQTGADTALDSSIGLASKALAPVAAMDQIREQRMQYNQLADMMGGGKGQASKKFPQGMTADTYKQFGDVQKSQREERRLDNTDRALIAQSNRFDTTRGDKLNAQARPSTPSAARVRQVAEALLGQSGYRIGRIGGSDRIFKGDSNDADPNGPKIMSQALQMAQQQLSQPRGQNPQVTQNPAVRAISNMLKAEQTQSLPPHQAPLLQRFRTNYEVHKKALLQQGHDEATAKEQAMIQASSDVIGGTR